jgi:hypothetical protein
MSSKIIGSYVCVIRVKGGNTSWLTHFFYL